MIWQLACDENMDKEIAEFIGNSIPLVNTRKILE